MDEKTEALTEFDDASLAEANEKQAKKAKRIKIFKISLASIFTIGANMLVLLMIWIMDRYDNVQFDQILYQIKSPVAGTSGGLIESALLRVVLLGFVLGVLEILVYIFFAGIFKNRLSKFARYVKYSASRAARFLKKRYLTMASLLLVISILTFIFGLGINSFLYNSVVESDFIEENYVDPDEVELTFPEEKRNVIYIFLESLENTFSDPTVGGNITENLMPELTELAKDNVSFTGKGGKYGAYSYVGTRWTAAALFTQTSGVIMQVPLNFDVYGVDGTYMPNITTLGDILDKAGYEQSVLFGSDAGFAARDVYFTEHGYDKIIDVYSLIEDGKLPANYWEWWGFEDVKLFDFAKEELLRLAATGKPFNFTTLTADTHFPDGYECPLCGDKYEQQYSNVISCSSKQVYEFIEWIKAQDFYENTTIILSGDHLTMDPKFLEGIDENYVRTTYNCIINSAVEPVRENDREFGTFDMFPTTLAAMGVTIEGERLGIGTNLFSDVDTFTEILGYEKLEKELQKRSDYYMETFYGYGDEEEES